MKTVTIDYNEFDELNQRAKDADKTKEEWMKEYNEKYNELDAKYRKLKIEQDRVSTDLIYANSVIAERNYYIKYLKQKTDNLNDKVLKTENRIVDLKNEIFRYRDLLHEIKDTTAPLLHFLPRKLYKRVVTAIESNK
jgi:chromosome segregation ATPase